ncbi:hypothetical protein tinsulaeT_02940 [Thalassotalea insulae]|uniref:histidine kinase n=1 Tax=Thalassotalea insulae TaxID=2056778 RepID=A0ABQ6GNR1_9GAMM|nr:response regulator [Thalassotalea insulae]GLX76954.1 hypothetical protein tinsulaeT_02940 [Thalassotalea insulae]
MFTINSSYFLLGSQGLLAFILTYIFWLNHLKTKGSIALLGFGLCLLIYAVVITTTLTDIKIAVLGATLVSAFALLCLQLSLSQLIKMKTFPTLFYCYALITALALINYASAENTLFMIAIALLLAVSYITLLFLLNHQLKAFYPKHVIFITLATIFYALAQIRIITIALLVPATPAIIDNTLLIATNIAICAGIAVIFGIITLTAKAKEQYLKAFSQGKSEFITNVSHEVRTPMNGILGMLSLLEQSQLTAQQQHKVSIAKNSAYSLLAVINEVLDLSKIESGTLEPEIVTVDIKQLIEETAETFALQCHLKEVELIVDCTKITEQFIMTDPSKVTQIISNLLSNAVKFTDKGEIILHVALTQIDQESFLLEGSVTDTGIGIAPEKLLLLLQEHPAKRHARQHHYSANALGLKLTKTLCSLLEGTLSASSQPEHGSCFNFTIKVATTEQPALSGNNHDLTAHTILIADNNKTSANLLNDTLAKLGANVVITSTEQETINTLKLRQDTPFDFAFVSEKLFSRDLNDFMQNIKDINNINNVKFVLMAYLDCSYDKNTLLISNFKQLIYKPLLSSSLNVILDRLIYSQDRQPSANHGILKNEQGASKLLPGKTVLVVEDNKINQMVVLGVLKQLKTRILIANNGHEAIKILKKKGHQIDLVLMDCLMPEMDGYQATQLIRNGEAGEQNSNIVIIALTASAMENEKAKCLALGMNEVLTKPINSDILTATMNFWLTPKEKRYCH